MNHAGPFSGDAETVIRWVQVGGIVLALAAVAVLVWVMTRQPAWRLTVAAKWTLLVGLFLLPASTMLMSNVVGFHKVKQSCAECHTMDPWVADMTDPSSATLAAKHHQNRWINEDQCYTCHTGYGFAGNLEAKIGGLRHVMHTYVTGVPEEIRIRRPFPVATCLHCHAEARSYLAIEQHVAPEYQADILSGKMSCFECHEAPHPRKKP